MSYVEDLMSALRDNDPTRRQDAVKALHETYDLDAAGAGVRTLQSLAEDDPAGNEWAADALRSIAEDPGAYDVLRAHANRALEGLGAGQKPSRPEDLEGSARDQALERKAEYRQKAIEWWRQTDRAEAICDDCNTRIPRGEGYLRPGYLACEGCTDKMVSGYYL